MIAQALELYQDAFIPCRSTEQLYAVFKAHLKTLGIDYHNYSLLVDQPALRCWKLRSWETPWDTHYLEHHYHLYDEVGLYCQSHFAPRAWIDIALDQRLQCIQSRIAGDGRDFGIYGGRVYPLARLDPAYFGVFNIVDLDPEGGLSKAVGERDGLFHAVAQFFHLAMWQLSRGALPPDGVGQVETRISPRERDCLSWLAAGLRPEEIGERLGICRVTVDMHLRSARRRLGARTREQALAIAVREKLILP